MTQLKLNFFYCPGVASYYMGYLGYIYSGCRNIFNFVCFANIYAIYRCNICIYTFFRDAILLFNIKYKKVWNI